MVSTKHFNLWKKKVPFDVWKEKRLFLLICDNISWIVAFNKVSWVQYKVLCNTRNLICRLIRFYNRSVHTVCLWTKCRSQQRTSLTLFKLWRHIQCKQRNAVKQTIFKNELVLSSFRRLINIHFIQSLMQTRPEQEATQPEQELDLKKMLRFWVH